MNRADAYNNLFSARALFTAALVIMPALLFNPSTELRVIQFLFFWLLSFLSGKKINFIITFLVTLLIIAFNLIIPYGKVLYSAGIFRITSGALEAGVHRAVTLQALVMLSKAAVRQDLTFPGTFGGVLGSSLRVFSGLMGMKYRITGKNFISDIDKMLLDLSGEEIKDIDVHITKTKPAGFIILFFVIIISWLPWVKIFFG
jgi:heptaprenyl diphosphate synthase